ncbi:hypothetical protein EA187_06090 [Lujinxingia sediminis]|uniref:DUF4013 domain-containing protein n=1 Tax=Lujinxingia sediminis TaxID=2480984 RepID=A0ABY0CV93_9DELT|nr:hypothetical protein [Lujinxingia sediminis]RVU46705.1 hypothetical protein EA187_06090 [Lujinxingia sediminis]
MNLGEWKRDFFYVWRQSRGTVALHIVPMVVVSAMWCWLYVLAPLAAVVAFLPLAIASLGWWAYLHRVTYCELYPEHAAESVGLPWFGRTVLGVVVWMGLYMVGSVFVLPALAVLALLMPYLYFIIGEGEGPIEALQINMRLVGDRLLEVFAFWGVSFGVSLAISVAGAIPLVFAFFMGVESEDRVVSGALFLLGALGYLGMVLFMYSVHMAVSLTAYRVLRGKSIDAMEAVGRREEGAGLPSRG